MRLLVDLGSSPMSVMEYLQATALLSRKSLLSSCKIRGRWQYGDSEIFNTLLPFGRRFIRQVLGGIELQCQRNPVQCRSQFVKVVPNDCSLPALRSAYQ